MDLQQMRYAIAVAEERNFTRAAARCHVVQSALSHQIKALEQELGVELFARTSRRVEVTPAGEAFLDAARTSVAAAERAASDAVATTGEIRGTLTIGVIPTVTAIDLPALLSGFRRQHPAVRIALRSGGSDEFLEAIAAGRMDAAVLGLAGDVAHAGIESRELAREDLVAVVSSRHPLADRRRVRLADLESEPYVDFPAGTPGRAQSDAAFTAAGIDRDVAFEAMDIALMLGLVRTGLAIAFLPRAVVADAPDVRCLTVVGAPSRIEHLAWSGFNPTPAAKAFISAVESEYPARKGGTHE
ncbi:LysR family transcriptional regulator [Microbacterium sp. GXF6406]